MFKDYDVLDKAGYFPNRWDRCDPGQWAKNIKGQFIYVSTYDGKVDGLKMYFYDGQSSVSLRLGRREGEAVEVLQDRLLKAARLLGFKEQHPGGGLK